MRTIKLPFKLRKPVLACGADLKGAFAIAKGNIAYLFDGLGDLSQLNNFAKYEKAVRSAKIKCRVSPKLVICDMHPGYFSTQFAERFSPYKAQHHEAHIASAITENNIKGDVLGVAFDGTGYGLDGNIWGGEFFKGSVSSLKRIWHLDYIPMPGGEACIKEPWRMAVSYLYSIYGDKFLKFRIGFVKKIDRKKWAVLKKMIDKKINSPLTSSMGRLFDAAASMILNKKNSEFEAQLPIELEHIVRPGIDDSYNPDDSVDIIKGVVRDLESNTEAGVISAKFHNSIAELILKMAKKSALKKVVLTGGVFQNSYLTERTTRLLKKNNFNVYTHVGVQMNDSGIPLGQIAIANERLLCA